MFGWVNISHAEENSVTSIDVSNNPGVAPFLIRFGRISDFEGMVVAMTKEEFETFVFQVNSAMHEYDYEVEVEVSPV